MINAVNFTSFGSGCNPAAMTANASGGGTGAVLRPGYGLTPGYSWGGNVVTCMDNAGVDMSMSDCLTFSATMPPGDVYAFGNTTVARLVAAGITSNYSVVPAAANAGNVGANLNTIYADTGTVTHVRVAVSPFAAQVSYTAPDNRACVVDISQNASTWTRVAGSGGWSGPGRGPRAGNATFTGLTPASVYQYRILCYFEQTSDLFSGDQITDGTFFTPSTGSASPSFSFSLADFASATSFKVTLTAVDGTQYAGTCITSPCVVPNVPLGDYSTVQQWFAGSTAVASSDAQLVAVR